MSFPSTKKHVHKNMMAWHHTPVPHARADGTSMSSMHMKVALAGLQLHVLAGTTKKMVVASCPACDCL